MALLEHPVSFSDTLGDEMIRIILAPKGSTPKSFLIHSKRLKAESEYFAGLLRFPGIESDTKEVTLSEGYEGLEDAFEAFIEWIYTRKLELRRNKAPVCVLAELIALTERLMAERCQSEALKRFESKLKCLGFCTYDNDELGGQFAYLIRRIYHGVPRPHQISDEERNKIEFSPFICEPGSTGEKQHLIDKQKKMGYINCKARKLVAEHASRKLRALRESREFRSVVEEIGEFACDLLMEKSGEEVSKAELETGLVKVVDRDW